ncbi:Sugar phosphate isomerase/epimerase [Sphingobium sp. AP50]|nr:Sugar phosphate isomerase/epimerase [Sphingobium sp. AP50]
MFRENNMLAAAPVGRRRFLAGAGLTLAAGLGAGPRAMAQLAASSIAPSVGIQLYTVMPSLSRDFEGTIRDIAQIGYKEVETIGSFGRDPVEVKALFDKYGLVSPSQHIVSNELYRVFDLWVKRQIAIADRDKAFLHEFDLSRIDETVPAAIASAKAMGQRYVIWQAIFASQIATPEATRKLIAALNHAGDLCADAGLTFGFHNHDRELEKVNGVSAYDRILAETNPARVKMEIDFYWMKKAGADYGAYLKHNPGRFKLCHLKDMDRRGNIIAPGSGVMVSRELIDMARSAGIEHFIVENDSSAIPFSAERNAFGFMTEIMQP